MHTTIEMLAMGAELRREAETRCPSVNEAHFMVHEIMLEALAAPAVQCRHTARDLMFARLDGKLMDGDAARDSGRAAFVQID